MQQIGIPRMSTPFDFLGNQKFVHAATRVVMAMVALEAIGAICLPFIAR